MAQQNNNTLLYVLLGVAAIGGVAWYMKSIKDMKTTQQTNPNFNLNTAESDFPIVDVGPNPPAESDFPIVGPKPPTVVNPVLENQNTQVTRNTKPSSLFVAENSTNTSSGSSNRDSLLVDKNLQPPQSLGNIELFNI